ncbi:hypothetical protein IMAU60045_01100 [Lactiplantibacillus plantarum]|nr:hypothetical protein [Lactiplantibacillus plantarum]
MTKTLKQLVHVLWAIEKDLHVIASNTGARKIKDLPKRLTQGQVNGRSLNLGNNHKSHS